MKSVEVPQQFVGWRTGCAVLQVFVLYKKRLIKANSFSNGLTHFGYWSFLCLAKTKSRFSDVSRGYKKRSVA